MAERDIVEDLREGATVLDEWYHRESVAHTMLRAADEIERLRASTPEGSETQDRTMDGCDPARATYTRAISPPSHDTEPSVLTRTSERGLSYHDGTEALREALEEIATHAEAGTKGSRPTYDLFRHIARRALSQHVGGEG